MWKIDRTVEDTESANNFGFMKDPHEDLYPAAFEGDKMRSDANQNLRNYVLNEIEKEYPNPDSFIAFTVYGSGASYNWDEEGDFDIQMWVDFAKFQEGNKVRIDADELLADIRRIVQPINFPSFKELELDTDDCEGAMLIQYYPKPGIGSKEENLASQPYACYDMDNDEWMYHPEPITPEFYGDGFLMTMPKAEDVAMQAEAVLSELERNTVNWQFWRSMAEKFDSKAYTAEAMDAQDKANAAKEGVVNLFENVFQGRAGAYSETGKGIKDERDILQKLLEVWGIFQRLKHFARQPLPWEEQELPSPPQKPEEVTSRWRFEAQLVESPQITVDPGINPMASVDPEMYNIAYIYDPKTNHLVVAPGYRFHTSLIGQYFPEENITGEDRKYGDLIAGWGNLHEGYQSFSGHAGLADELVPYIDQVIESKIQRESAWRIAMPSTDYVDFFDQASRGMYSPQTYLNPTFDDTTNQHFYNTYKQYAGNFDQHIETSIPGYRELQVKKGAAITKAFPQATVMDIGGSEGSWAKAITQSGGNRTVNVEPNAAMVQHYNKNPLENAEIIPHAFGEGFEYGGVTYPKFDAQETYDIINESMTFQFISPDRPNQIQEVKKFLSPGGLFLTDEKVITPNWAENEAIKDNWKQQFYDTQQLLDKQKVVNYGDEESAVGMVSNMVPQEQLEAVLGEHFASVQLYWSSGNFVGYACSDNPVTVQTFVQAFGPAQQRSSMVKEAVWSDIVEKAQRYYDEGRVQLQNNTPDHVVATVEGDTGTYNTELWRDDPNNPDVISLWGCDCPWGQKSWGRTRIWKKYEGRPCAHAVVVNWESQRSPQDAGFGENEQQQLFSPEQTMPDQPSFEQQMADPSQGTEPMVPAQPYAPPGKPPGSFLKGPKDIKQLELPGTFSRWERESVAIYNNGDFVRAKEPLYGYDDRGTGYVVPRNMAGEVIWSDEETTIAIFSIESGPLGAHLVRVECDTEQLMKAPPNMRGPAPRRRRAN